MRKARVGIVFVLVLGLVLSLTACGGNGDLKGQAKSETKDLMGNRNQDAIYCFTDEILAYDGYDEAKVTAALGEFSLRLFEENMDVWGDADTNILISPVSIITALGMTSFGAKGNTLTQMEEMFGVTRGYLNQHNLKYMESDAKELKLANSIWVINDGRLTVKDEFLQFNDECYDASVYETAFNDATVDSINDWVEQNTDGMIKEILDEIPADAVMYLINALVFEAEWADKYEETQIRENMKFTTGKGMEQRVDMMFSEESLYLADENAKGFIKYYKGGKYAFAALLPNEGITLADYVKNLSGEHLKDLLANPYTGGMVTAYLPQFSYEYAIEMSDLLVEMGMTDAFDGAKADFSGMATSTQGNIYMNRVIHKTFIEVSPVGTKAGAATVVEMNDECAPWYDEVYEVRLDRPFLYMIIDLENNMPLFIGSVNSIE